MQFFILCIDSGENIPVEARLLAFSGASKLSGYSEPIASSATKFHLLCLRNDRLYAISRLNGEIVEEIPLNKDVDGKALALSFDPILKVNWMLTEFGIFKILCNREDRHVWAVYLKKAIKGDESCFDNAIQHAQTKVSFYDECNRISHLLIYELGSRVRNIEIPSTILSPTRSL